MKITKVHVLHENLELTRPYTIAYKTISAVENVFLVLELADGTRGVGCAAPAPAVTGETTLDALHALRDTVEPLLHGADIRYLPALLERARAALPGCPAALAAVDIALHDAFTRHLGVRLVDWWGAVYQGLPTSITIGILPLDETLAQAREHLAAGFRAIKLKTGRGVEEDVAVFRRLRETVGPHITIRVDANQGYVPSDLTAFAAATAEADVEFHEQPFPAGHHRGDVKDGGGPAAQLSLPPELRRRCAADEDLHDATDAQRLLIEPRPYGIFNIKLMKCGGVTEARRIADLARRADTELMWGCNDESIVSITAALHAALACPATRYLDLDGSLDLARDLVTGGFILHDGYLSAGEGNGLGVEMI